MIRIRTKVTMFTTEHKNYSRFCWQILFSGLLATYVQSAQACKCEVGSFKKDYKRADVIVAVEVLIATQQDERSVEYTLKKSKSWKSNLAESMIITVEKDSCEYPLLKGEHYLLYLERLPSGAYTTSQCKGNRRQTEAAQAIRWLNRKAKSTNG
jgi:hypothetical protein